MNARPRPGEGTVAPVASVEGGSPTDRSPVRIELGAWMPLPLLRVAFVAVACLAFAVAPLPYALAAVVLAIVGAALPAGLLGWGAAVVIAMAQLLNPGALTDPRPYLALLAVHLLHVLAGLILVLPARGRLQLRALAAPARRFVLIEVVAQPLLALALWARAADVPLGVGGDAVAIGAAVCAVAIVVLLWVLARRR